MSKVIKLTDKQVDEIRADFEKYLSSLRMTDGKISFTKVIPGSNRRASLRFTKTAWEKMDGLVQEFNSEVAWHGVAYRDEDAEKDEYIIEDIIVYPQTVTGATVEMDEAAYAKWLQENDDDERFFNIRMQGHSHVNMGVTPSSVDLNHQEAILASVPKDGFYIFVIWNKRNERNIKIYDLAKNILFENADVDVTYDVDCDLYKFLEDAKDMVVDRPIIPATKAKSKFNGYTGGSGIGYYGTPASGYGSEGTGLWKKSKKGRWSFLDDDDEDEADAMASAYRDASAYWGDYGY